MLRRVLESETSLWISRVVIAAIFLAYGATKIHLPGTLAESVHNYRIVPIAMENIMGIMLPWIEVVAALALLRRRTLPGGAAVTGGLLVVFLVAIGSAIVRGLDINCGCFTLSATSPSYNNLWRTFALDSVLLLMTIHIWWRLSRKDGPLPSPVGSEQ